MTNASRSGDATGTTGRAGRGGWVAPLCWSAVALEGFDLVVLGVVLPSLLDEPSWGLTPATASLVSTAGLLGVMVGALSAGPLADLLGRRRAMLATVVSFSVLTLLCAVATGPWTFGALRFLAGLGLGGVLPVALAMVNEHSRSGRGGSATTVLMTGYHVGAVATSLLGILVIPFWGWRPMFVLGALPALVLVPLLARFLPDSRPVPQAATPAAAPRARNPIAQLVRDGYLRSSVAFWVASFMGLLLVYGLNTWLPQIMRSAGFALGSSLAFLLVLNLGAIVGAISASFIADRIGVQKVVTASFLLACVAIFLISLNLPAGLLFLLVAVAGLGSVGTQILVGGFCATHYPQKLGATALAWSLGIGRIGAICGPLLGGLIAGWAMGYQVNFYAFAVVAVAGALVVGSIRTQNRQDPIGSPKSPATISPTASTQTG